MSRQSPIKILTASSFILELSESAVSVSNSLTIKRTTGAMMEIMFVVESLDLGCGTK